MAQIQQASGNFLEFWSICQERITQLLQICRLYIHDVNLPFQYILKNALLDWDLVVSSLKP